MKPPRKAIILAAGLGTRMRPLTLARPKPLMPFCGVPILEQCIRQMASWGVKEIAINLHHRADVIAEWLRTSSFEGVQISISYEPEILGTGGPLRRLEWFIDNQPFWLYNADVVGEVDPKLFLKAIARPSSIAALWMHPSRGPRTVEVDKGLVTNFISKNPGSTDTYTFCGLHLIHPRLLNYLPKQEGFSSIITAYQKAMKAGEKIHSVAPDGAFWCDLGTPQQYLEAHREKLGEGFVSVEPGAKVSPKARMSNTVVWKNATVSASARVSNAIVGGATSRGKLSNLIVPPELCLTSSEAKALANLELNLSSSAVMLFPARPSDRSYLRIRDAKQSVLLVRYGVARAENQQYVRHARFLDKQGVRVPRVLADKPRQRISVFEDLGDDDLQSLIAGAGRKTVIKRYRQAVDLMISLHQKGPAARRARLPLQPAFGAALYHWEHDYFSEHYLGTHCGIPMPGRTRVLKELRRVSKQLEAAKQVLIHRDLQSTNVMFCKGEAALIDFQGMRFGAAAYDLASLLMDPYVTLEAQIQTALLEYYLEQSGDAETESLFWLAGIQRLGQALGAYARLGRMKGTERFSDFIEPGEEMMRRALEQTSELPVLRSLME